VSCGLNKIEKERPPMKVKAGVEVAVKEIKTEAEPPKFVG
jgi:hypothetical protein